MIAGHLFADPDLPDDYDKTADGARTDRTNVGRVQEESDPERLLVEALRAHAVRTPDHTGLAAPRVPPLPGWESGSPPASGNMSQNRRRSHPFVPAWWIMLLAVLFGLVTGVIVGVVSLM